MSEPRDILVRRVADATGLSEEQLLSLIGTPPQAELGDYALPCFVLAGKYGKSPHAVAKELADKLDMPDVFADPEPAGAYLNFRFKAAPYMQWALREVVRHGDGFGRSAIGRGKTVCIDYGAPNIAKHLAIHHIRSHMIGNSLTKIFAYLGYHVVGMNYLGDWGTHFGKLIAAYKRWGREDPLEHDAVATLNSLLIRFTREAGANPALDEEARRWFRRIEDGDQEAVKLWRKFRDVSLCEFDKLYRRLGLHFDDYTGESYFHDKTDAVIEEAKHSGIAKISEGALVVDVGEDMPPCLLQKSDGATLYATRDIAAALHRWKQYRFDQCLYVVDSGQALHFRQLFAVLGKMGRAWVARMHHVPFGIVLMKREDGTWGRGRTRTGEVVLLQDVLDEAEMRMKQIAVANNVRDADAVASGVGISAVVFHELRTHRSRDVHFDWEIMLNPKGETAPYVQYTHARICSVFEKFEGDFRPEAGLEHVGKLRFPQEFQLAKEIMRFPSLVRRAAMEYDPSLIAAFTIDVCRTFGAWYDLGRKDSHAKLLTPDRQVSLARLTLAWCTRYVVAQSLHLLGIRPLEHM